MQVSLDRPSLKKTYVKNKKRDQKAGQRHPGQAFIVRAACVFLRIIITSSDGQEQIAHNMICSETSVVELCIR